MRRVFSLILILPVIYLGFLSYYLYRVSDLEQRELEQYHLSKATNYAADAAVMEMTLTGSLELDYTNWSNIKVDPEIAKDTFATLMCENYNIRPDRYNLDTILNSNTKLFCVAAIDGYYIYESKLVNKLTNEYSFVGTPKLPYTYKVGNNCYGLRLDGKKAFKVVVGSPNVEEVDTPISNKATLLKEINTLLSDDLSYHLDEQYAGGFTQSLYIPSELTSLSRTNAVKGPSVIALVDGIDTYAYSKDLKSFSIGGTRITNQRQIAAYVRNGKKYYCYEDMLPSSVTSSIESYVDNMYTSMQAAAQDGYHPDPIYLR